MSRASRERRGSDLLRWCLCHVTKKHV